MMMMESASTSELLLAMTTACNMRHPSLTKLTKLQGLIQAVSNKLCFVGEEAEDTRKFRCGRAPNWFSKVHVLKIDTIMNNNTWVFVGFIYCVPAKFLACIRVHQCYFGN